MLSRPTRARCGTCASTAPSSPQSRGCHEFCTVRNTRSGCGIRIVKRPSAVVSAGDAVRRAVRVVRVAPRSAAPRLSTKRSATSALRAAVAARVAELGVALAVRDRDRHAAARHAARRRATAIGSTSTSDEARLELLASGCARSAASASAPGMISLAGRHHLAAVADAEREACRGARRSAANCVARARR